jgi:hypothetical protein
VPGYVEDELRGYLECGLLCFGLARALRTGCRTGFVVAFSCKGRGVCPSSSGRHMAQTAAHLADHVIPPVPVRQWVISVPKRLRGFLADRPPAVAALTEIFLDEIERLLCAAAGVTSDAATPASARPRLGGISFLHRFGSALNHHLHLRDSSHRRCLRAGYCRSRVRRPAGVPAGAANHSRPSGRAHRAGAPPRDTLVQAFSPLRRRGRRRHARLGEQRVFSGRFSSGSRSYRPKCVSRVSLSNTCCGTAPGRHSPWNGSP